MSLRLLLIRHAKSAWDDPVCADRDRPLAARGQRAAPLIGRWIADQGHAPGQALVSSARRTCETWSLLAPLLGDPPAVFLDALYHAPPDVMLRCLRSAESPVVALVGHNPGIAEFAAQMLARPPRNADFLRFPTCATLIAEFPAADWAELRRGTGRLIAFTTPRTLDSAA
ncbi:SixA phosphatase family protein [Plastorhodobacter daqingensis]|uniref:SixA phosphatase family protein n=1 Tax=Plastorhodobacter daqingensis TaxID=1387281 RepID=A0ABW2UHQ2_9RHOB